MNLANLVGVVVIVLIAVVALGFFIFAQRVFTQAVREDQAQARKQSEAATVYIIRAYAKRDAGDLTGAIADFKKALSVQPDHPDAQAVRAAIDELNGAQPMRK